MTERLLDRGDRVAATVRRDDALAETIPVLQGWSLTGSRATSVPDFLRFSGIPRPSGLPSPFPRPTGGWQFKMRQLGAAIQTMIAAVETKNVE
jgi:hypothetical protein